MNKYHYTYLLIEDVTEMLYIGVRTSKVPPDEDPYMGSSKYVPVANCDKIVLNEFSTREEAIQDEIRLHYLYDVCKNTMFYNRAKQTSTGFDSTGIVRDPERYKAPKSTKHKQAISKALKGRIISEEARVKASKTKIEKYGRPVICVELNRVFNSVKEAAKFVMLKSPSDIVRMCKGKGRCKLVGGYTWKYVTNKID